MYVDAPLSNGQLYSWREVDTYPPDWKKEANLPATWDLRGLSLGAVQAAVQQLIRRHEPLRTTYHLVDGVPVQRVHADVPAPIEHVDRMITDYGDPDRTTATLVDVAFPMTDSICWRGVLVCTDDAPMFLSLSFSHLILDVWSIIELEAQFQALVRTPAAPTADATTEPVAWPPRELARAHRDPAWAGKQASAERYWRRVLTDSSVPRLRTLPTGETRQRIQATLHSPQLGGLASLAAKQHGVSAPAVVMALITAGLSEYTGADRVALSVMSSNRFAPEFQHVVGTLNQLVPVLATVDPAAPIGEQITRLHWACAKAYRNSCYDVDRIAALAAELGVTGDHDCWFNQLFPCWFNYLQLDSQPCDAADPTPAELVWTPVARQYGQPFDVRVTVKGGRMSVALRVDPEVVPPQGVTDLLRSVAAGVHRAITAPESPLKDIWSTRADELAPSLFPQEIPPRP